MSISANLAAFLRVIRAGESSQSDDAYRTMFGGGKFDNFADHPRQTNSVGGFTSTAAGAYQFLSSTWDACVRALHLPDFSPASQDLAAVYLIRNRNALDDVEAGRIRDAISKCGKEWASLPGSPYGQPTMTMAKALAVYAQYGGSLEAQATQPSPVPEKAPAAPIPPSPAPSEYMPPGEAAGWTPPAQPEPTMPLPALIGALLPSIIESIPKLGKLFGSGSQVSERNIAAAQLVVDTVKAATGASNEQAAVEKLKSDPVALQAAQQAISEKWLEITEAGGGGIEGAGKRDAAMAASGDLLRSPSFWVALALLPLVYMIVANVVGLIGTPLGDEVRSAISNGVVGLVLGGLIGYYYGQTTSRNRTPAESK